MNINLNEDPNLNPNPNLNSIPICLILLSQFESGKSFLFIRYARRSKFNGILIGITHLETILYTRKE